jgi:hypothetical protein
MDLDAGAVLLQWAVGGLAFCWFTTRRRQVGLGYGWMLRGTYGLMAIGAVVLGVAHDAPLLQTVSAAGVVAGTAAALTVSVVRRRAGVSGQAAEHDRRSARVAAMTGIDRQVDSLERSDGPEFPPALDVVAPAIGVLGLVAAGVDAAGGGTSVAVSLLRMFAGAALLGGVTDAMLLGHWYLVQPGLPRSLLLELVRAVQWVAPVAIVAMLAPVGMLRVLTGDIDDGWNGMLGWFWVACAVTTVVLLAVTRAALKERQYSAVMAATGLLYLAILTAAGTDLVARAVLA